MPEPLTSPDQSRGSLPISVTDPSGATIYQRPAPGTQYFSPVTNQTYPMAPPDPGIGFGDAISQTGGMIGRGIADVGRGIGNAFTGAAQSYLGSEQQLLSGQMSWPDLSGFVASHILPTKLPTMFDAATGLDRPTVPVEPLSQPASALAQLRAGSRVPDWYREAQTPPVWPGGPGQENVVHFPATRSGFPEPDNPGLWVSEDGYPFYRSADTGNWHMGGPGGGDVFPDFNGRPGFRDPRTGEVGPFRYMEDGPPETAPRGAPGEQKIFDIDAERQARRLQGLDPESRNIMGSLLDSMKSAPQDELRRSLAAFTGRDPASFQNVQQEAQQYLNQMWLRPDLDPAQRSMLGHWARMHDLIMPDA